ncbi:MAG: DsbA family protein [Nonlabens sp.]
MKILYVYDALCGWCYGFSPVITEFVDRHNLDYEVVSSGMITGDRIGPIGKVAPYIKQAYKEVEERCGVTFGTDFLDVLDEGSMVFTSIQAAVAMSVFKEQGDGDELAFAKAEQEQIYYHGKAPGEAETFATLATQHGCDKEAFLRAMQDEAYLQKAHADFQLSQQLQVSGFPTVFLVQGQ